MLCVVVGKQPQIDMPIKEAKSARPQCCTHSSSQHDTSWSVLHVTLIKGTPAREDKLHMQIPHE